MGRLLGGEGTGLKAAAGEGARSTTAGADGTASCAAAGRRGKCVTPERCKLSSRC
jgi:hypothetical protein